ncbi:hypothetical protein J8I87_11810 [Paraburkholderia sp. LEh10]|uniref:hypothetical protein n=1 Tax=Paraburkholderia sp. LEh10 TaxID=2821353 RepID=UPI001AE68472|nr:hypothetical protein [Paraburkholderia sp. LEh10]MBP0590386.1 hypothetical protein [Paraburkholderia sp. LEh10]
MTIKAIETKYRGYRFRSRIEARWAVFFDAAGIKWDYEPEGYVVNDSPYLPDFFLPELGCYFEVKGHLDYDIEFFRSFAVEIGRSVVVAEGPIPDPEDWSCGDHIGLQVLHPHFDGQEGDDDDDFAWGYKDMFLRCDACGRIEIMNEVYSTMKDNCSCGEKHGRLMPLSDALAAARSARFEHGESPRGGLWSDIANQKLEASARGILIAAQRAVCAESGFPFFLPADGVCYACKADLVEKLGLILTKEPITGCPSCARSYCD